MARHQGISPRDGIRTRIPIIQGPRVEVFNRLSKPYCHGLVTGQLRNRYPSLEDTAALVGNTARCPCPEPADSAPAPR